MSAKGTATTARNKKTQGVFPIRGKIINAFASPYNKVFANEEVQGITRIILGKKGYTRNFDVSDCQVSKVIFMADADIDGAHIAALLLRLFVMYFPQMIKAGMVYKAVPPLYSIKEGKKTKYFTENIDMVKFIQKNFNQKYQITDLKNNKISDREMSKFFIRNADYIYYLEDVASTYALDPFLLEMILNSYVTNKKFDLKKLKKEIESTYRFMSVEKEGSSIIVSGTINESNAVILNNRFLSDCKMILPIIESNDVLNYKVNGKRCSIYTVMDLYSKSKPAHVQRYKGLGEMPDKELRESTMSAEGDRTLIRYTMESAKEEIEAIREYESDSKKILTLIHNVSREDLLD